MTLGELQAELARLKIEARITLERGAYVVELYWLVPGRGYERTGGKDPNLEEAVQHALRYARRLRQ